MTHRTAAALPNLRMTLALPNSGASAAIDQKQVGHSTSDELTRPLSLSSRAGQFVISLDFELYWGVRHLPTVAKYVKNLVGARTAIPVLLDLFKEYGIHATWATVGFLFFDRTEPLLSCAPALRPYYENIKLRPYEDLPPKDAQETSGSIFFAPSLIRNIAEAANQEIATHSFSHYYCLEKGQNRETFRQDLLAARAAARQLGLEIRTLVFPKNQCRSDYLGICPEADILAYRGNPIGWLYRAAADDEQTLPKRLGRLLDAYIPLTGCNCSSLPDSPAVGPINIPASRYLRPYSPILYPLDPLRLWRIKRDLTTAAKTGRLYHLWWHPHNFGAHLSDNLAFLRKILEHFRSLRDCFGIESLNMSEAAARCVATP
jgi:peptidoglycan/xylan/chitin deacetylase (PgdA/CDA1 family)